MGLAVWMEGSGVVVSQHADSPLRPGSTEKLLVAWGAYEALGPEATFVTDVKNVGNNEPGKREDRTGTEASAHVNC